MLNIGSRLLFILVIFLLVVNMFTYVLLNTTDEPVKLSTVLEKMKNAPTIEWSLDEAVATFKINEPWAVMDGLRVFINYMGSVIGFLVYLVSVLINLVSAVGYFLYLIGLSSFSAV